MVDSKNIKIYHIYLPFIVTVDVVEVVVVVVVVVVVGQSDISHRPASVEFPGQFSSPPKSGSLQARALSQVPWPQEALHSDHWPHACHSAFSAARIFLVQEYYKESQYLRILISRSDQPL